MKTKPGTQMIPYITKNDFLWNKSFQYSFEFWENASLKYWEKVHSSVSVEIWIDLNGSIRDFIIGNSPERNSETELMISGLQEQQCNLT